MLYQTSKLSACERMSAFLRMSNFGLKRILGNGGRLIVLYPVVTTHGQSGRCLAKVMKSLTRKKKSKYEQNVRFDDASNQIRAALNASPFWVLPQIWTLRIKVCFSVSLRVERWRKNRQSVGNQPPNDCLWSFGGNRLTNGSPCVLCHFLLMWSASDDQWSGCV